MSVLLILNSGNPGLSFLTPPFSLSPACTHTHKLSWPRTLQFQGKLYAFSPPFQSSYLPQNDDVELEGDEAAGIGDCLVFEEGVFEDPYLQNDSSYEKKSDADKKTKRKKKRNTVEIDAEDLIPEKWKQIQEEMNMTKKEKRKIRQQIEFGSRVEKRRQGYLPIRNLNLEEYLTYKETKLAQLRPLVLENPSNFREAEDSEEEGETDVNVSSSERLAPKNPKWAVYGRGLDDVSEFFNSGQYEPPDKKSEGPRKLFSKEEKVLLNKKMPDLASATSKKWLPLHTLAASGEFYLVDALLKHNVDINAVAKDGLTALHKAIIGKKQAVTNYLLRESANPFVHDEDGATLLHYAVQTASSPAIKMLLLYNVDINLQDNDGWTPLHLAVQGRRTDIVKLLLIKGADKTLKNNDGLTPLGLCLYSGRDTRTYELIKLLKQLPRTP